jgi:outer membrane protein OmpA-like peptidoglycan-associated protein
VFLGITSLSALFFFLFSLPKIQKARESRNQQTQTGGAQARTGNALPSPPTTAVQTGEQPSAPENGLPVPTEVQAPALLVYPKSESMVDTVFQELAQGKYEQLSKVLSPTVPTERKAALESVFTPGRFRPLAEKPDRIGRFAGDKERWRLNLAPAATPVTTHDPAAEKPLFVELDTKITREAGAQIFGIRFSDALGQALTQNGVPGLLVDAPDPLGMSYDFLEDLLARQFQAARSMTNSDAVPHEKLAGLCIVLEEGGYTLSPTQGLNVTSVNESSAWTIVKVKDEAGEQNEFGLEMQKDAKGQWQVKALNFDTMLQSYAQATEAGKVYYTPIIKNPEGGESLVVYFEYDSAALSPRTQRQLEIVAGLLKSDRARKISISGHTDSQGTADYNLTLSGRRANTVTSTLRRLGVDAAQIVEEARGEAQPLDPNERNDGSDNPEGRSRNRRTEIYLDF